MIKNHADGWYVTGNNHMEEDHVDRQHVIWNFTIEDHVDGWYVTKIITVKDHDDRYHMTDITVV